MNPTERKTTHSLQWFGLSQTYYNDLYTNKDKYRFGEKTMKSTRKLVLCMAVPLILIGTGLITAFHTISPTTRSVSTQEILEDSSILVGFTIGGCEEYIDPYNRSQLGIQHITWLDNTTVQITIHISMNCCGQTMSGVGYWIENNTMIHLIGYIDGTGLCFCSCGFCGTITLQNLQKTDYTFDFQYGFMIDHEFLLA